MMLENRYLIYNGCQYTVLISVNKLFIMVDDRGTQPVVFGSRLTQSTIELTAPMAPAPQCHVWQQRMCQDPLRIWPMRSRRATLWTIVCQRCARWCYCCFAYAVSEYVPNPVTLADWSEKYERTMASKHSVGTWYCHAKPKPPWQELSLQYHTDYRIACLYATHPLLTRLDFIFTCTTLRWPRVDRIHRSCILSLRFHGTWRGLAGRDLWGFSYEAMGISWNCLGQEILSSTNTNIGWSANLVKKCPRIKLWERSHDLTNQVSPRLTGVRLTKSATRHIQTPTCTTRSTKKQQRVAGCCRLLLVRCWSDSIVTSTAHDTLKTRISIEIIFRSAHILKLCQGSLLWVDPVGFDWTYLGLTYYRWRLDQQIDLPSLEMQHGSLEGPNQSLPSA